MSAGGASGGAGSGGGAAGGAGSSGSASGGAQGGAGANGGSSGAASSGSGGSQGSGSSGSASSAGSHGAGAGNSGAGTGASSGSGTVDWTSGFADDHKGFVQNKGWRNPVDAIDSYRNLEKLLGAPADQVIRLPRDDDPGAWESVHTRLGRPATPDGYKLDVPKEGGNPEFAKATADMFFKAGLSEKQASTVVEGWNTYLKTQQDSAKEAFNSKITTEVGDLKKEWGAAYEQNKNVAARAAREFGIDGKSIDALEGAIGHKGVMKLLHQVGARLGEGSFVTGRPSAGVPTPAQAKDQISALKNDTGFVKRYLAGDHKAREKMESLHRFAYPEED